MYILKPPAAGFYTPPLRGHAKKGATSKNVKNRQEGVKTNFDIFYAAPIGAFFCPEICAFTGFGARFLQPFPKSLVTVKEKF